MQPNLEMPAGGVKWLVPALLVSVVLDIVLAVILAVSVDYGALVGLIIAVSVLPTVAIISLVVPVGYEIWPTRLSIVFLFGRRWDVPFKSIESATEARSWQAYAIRGVRFATAPSQAIVMTRREARVIGRPNIVISPQDRSVFLPRLQQAIEHSPEA